jgi:NAD(P)-dependent dehydrogenase (short-subunit alcohol dehydrogenase family)
MEDRCQPLSYDLSGHVALITGANHVTGSASAALSAATHDQVFAVDARGSALMIAEFAQRHISRQAKWGRIIGLASGGPLGFPTEVSYGAAKAALENYTMSAAFELAPYGVTANIVYMTASCVRTSPRKESKSIPAV